MASEALVLGLAVLLAAAQLVLAAIPANLQLGSAWLAGPRDEKRELSGTPARLNRAFLNHVEGLALFTPAVVVVTLSGQATGYTAACAWIYFAARVVYVPLYAFGVAYLRSAVWAVGFLATIAMLTAALI